MEKDKIVENANKQYVQLTNALEKLKNTEEALTKKKAEYNATIKNYEKKLTNLAEASTVNSFDKNNEEISKNEAKAFEEKIEALEKENASSKKKMCDLEKEYSSSQKTMEALKKDYYALSNFVSVLKQTIAGTIENLNQIKDATSREAMSEVIYENITKLNSALEYKKED